VPYDPREVARYRIEEHLASGGMGEVYRARLVGEGGATKKVALKLVRGELAENGDFVTMFVDEARVAMTLSHANVVQAFDVGRVDERWFIAMEFVDGPTLGQLARAHRKLRGEPLPTRLAVTAMVEALKGLDYAHRRRDDHGSALGLVHRDISPGNVLVSREGEVKLTDFGIAKSEITAGESNAGTIKGKIAYMAPEQLRGERVDARADVYAAGVVLFELLAGKRPFDGPNQLALAPDVLAGRRPKLSALRPGVEEELERVVDRAMAIDSARRYDTAAAMRQDLEALAMKRGWLLSTTDIADLIEELEDEVRAGDADAAEQEPRSRTRIATFREEPLAADEFDLRLGAELRRVSSDEPVSVFVTGFAEPAPSETVAATPAAISEDIPVSVVSEEVVLPTSRTGWMTIAVGLAVVGLAVAAGATNGFGLFADSGSAPVPAPVPAPRSAFPVPVPVPDPDPDPVPVPDPVPESDPESESDPVPESAPGPATVVRMGTLSVASDPWGWVYIDGRQVGRTTLRDHRVRAGRHEIVVRNPAAGLEARRVVTISAGRAERVSLTLGEGGP